jgi:hypothetical protein
MRHYTEDELILYHYGEARRRDQIDEHLQVCAGCADVHRRIVEALAIVGDANVPERDDFYGLEVWQRIRHRLPVQDPPWWMAWYRPALAGAIASLIVAAFVAGRFWSAAPPEQLAAAPTPVVPAAAADDDARVRLAAIADHLEQSERILLDLVNASGERVDVSPQQAWAANLIDANRLYRHAAERAGDDGVAGVLDEIERNLLEIVHGPSSLSTAELEAVRVRIDAAALLFKVRILSGELREQELAPPSQSRKTT